jgi:hypothetical protein
MARPDYYQILGVPPSASPEEIRAVHRELVKRYHPDIYSTSGDKARATEKLQAINEAYAVVGNPERRKEYDASRVARPRGFEQAATRSPPRPMGRATVRTRSRPQTASRPARTRPKFSPWPKRIRARWLGVGIAAALIFISVAYLADTSPRVTPVWVMLQRTVIESGGSEQETADSRWRRIGSFVSRADCAAGLKEQVRRDEREGSRVIIDEAGGTLAITVRLIATNSVGSADSPGTDMTTQDAHETSRPNSGDGNSAVTQALEEIKKLSPKKEVTKRITHYECRMTHVQAPESWLRRKLKQVGVFS